MYCWRVKNCVACFHCNLNIISCIFFFFIFMNSLMKHSCCLMLQFLSVIIILKRNDHFIFTLFIIVAINFIWTFSLIEDHTLFASIFHRSLSTLQKDFSKTSLMIAMHFIFLFFNKTLKFKNSFRNLMSFINIYNFSWLNKFMLIAINLRASIFAMLRKLTFVR